MLRIKADRMKDLKKFGFKQHPDPGFGEYLYRINCMLAWTNINKNTGKIETQYGKLEIRDLIKAGMVEEVKE